MRDHGRDAERGEQRVDEQARADAGDREPPVAAAAAQGIPHDEEGIGAGHHRHERRDERECEDLRIDEVHTFRRRKQSIVWSFTIPTACMNA